MDRLKEIFEDNNWKPIEKISIFQILELEENYRRSYSSPWINNQNLFTKRKRRTKSR